ncbi:hypothetical protein [Hafnia sp. HMSC23F03]|uniref:hypothetical protein n=1 Tax=Hafnia sp. HMSC23F03 TaxID=1581059 RepID=UPI0011132196|nr:hypothetical protein [Hafnia sp. HMSC23F03]
MNKTPKPIGAANSLSLMNNQDTELSPEKYPPHDILQAYFHQKNKNRAHNFIKRSHPRNKTIWKYENNTSQPSIPWLTEINDDYFKFPKPITNMRVLYSVVFSFFHLLILYSFS